MKKRFMVLVLVLLAGAMLLGCGAKAGDGKRQLTAELACEGVSNYCQRTFGWDPAEDDPELMYLAMGEETETEYQVIFRSYTGAFTYFYVAKADGATRMAEYVPALNLMSEAGTLDIWEYLD